MLPSWLTIAIAASVLGFAFNKLFPSNFRWFMRLRRPSWLKIESAIPFIWIFIFICGIASAAIAWDAQPGTVSTWALMLGYAVVEIAILGYMPLLCGFRSLRVGTIAGAVGFLLGCGLTAAAWRVSPQAGLLLLPYILWSPIGTFVTWAMIPLNPTHKSN